MGSVVIYTYLGWLGALGFAQAALCGDFRDGYLNGSRLYLYGIYERDEMYSIMKYEENMWILTAACLFTYPLDVLEHHG